VRDDETFCCMRCRLLQAPGVECAECSSPLMATLSNQRGLLRTNFGKASSQPSQHAKTKDVASMLGGILVYAGVVTGAVLWWPTLPLLAVGGIGAGTFAALRHRAAIAAVDPFPIAAGGVAYEGVAHRLVETVSAVTDQSVVLAEQAVVHNKRGILFRRVRAVPFLVELADGNRVVVAGTLRLETPSGLTASTTKVKAGDPRLVALGIEGVPVSGELTVQHVRDGDRIEVRGDPTSEIVPELAFHRDGGEATVLRGRAGSVVAIRTR
jgi:hypothetical protein